VGLIPTIKTWGAERLLSSDLNGALSAFRNTVNGTALFTDVARTVTATLTFTAAPVIAGAMSFGDSATVANGLTVTAGGATVTAGGLTVSAGTSTFGAAVDVTGTVTATAFAGGGSGLTNLDAASLTGALPAISGANLTALNGTNVTTGTVAQARLPSIYTSLGVSGTISASNTGGSPQSLLSLASNYVASGASTPTALASAPAVGSGWAWVKVSTNLGDGYMPVLLT